MKSRSFPLRLVLLVGLASAIAWLAWHRELLRAAALERQLERFGHWAPILFVLLYAVATVLFVPGAVLTVVGGALFGPAWGSLWNLAGAGCGATLAFLLARYIGSGWLRRRVVLTSLMRGVEAEGWRFVAFVRLVPLFPFNLVNYAFGLTGIRVTEYLLASLVFMTPGAVAYTYLGYAAREAAAGSFSAVRSSLIALGLLAAVTFLPRLVRRLRAADDFIDPTELKRRLENGPPTVLIDVRAPDEFDGPLGHIPGARNIVLSELAPMLHNFSAMKDMPFVFICKTDRRSAKAAQLFKDAGFRQVLVLRGGMKQWRNEGLAVERATNPSLSQR